MDELELLKKDWKSKNTLFPKVSSDDIYKMIAKRSTSIVKWIFIIGLLEFVFWTLLSFVFSELNGPEVSALYDENYILIFSILGYVILAYFFFLFYKNYRKISSTDNAKSLMESILKTRRTVKLYVGFNLAFLITGIAIGVIYELSHNPTLIKDIDAAMVNGETFAFYSGLIIGMLLLLVILVSILLGFYYLVYGILLRRLSKNYKELKRMDF